MPTINVDGQSLSIDGQRLWIVSGTIAYHRVPAGLWNARLAAARAAGLNCIETPVVWSLHEPRPGAFNFSGDLDLPAFVRLIAQHRMHCILRVGPYVGEGLDFGGMPPWILESAPGRLRSGAPEFLQPVSRYLTALCEKIQPLQASLRRKNVGPIIAVQNEHRWLCGSETRANAYLAETHRFLRENGITVPIIAANQLFAAAEGEIEGWIGERHLHANLRQLRAMRSQQPRIVVSLPTAPRSSWGAAPESLPSPGVIVRRIGEVLAAGGQFNLDPFHAGTNFGFTAGRIDDAPDAFACTNPAPVAPLGESGERGPLYHAVRRISTFASQFARVLVALDPTYQPAIASLDGEEASRGRERKPASEGPMVAVECRGTQGSIVFVFTHPGDRTIRRRTSVVLADGSSLPVEIQRDPVAWMLLDAHLVGRATLDHCNLSAFALVGRVFVCYGPAGAPGVLSINGSAFEIIVPAGSEPHVSEHEEITVVVCNEDSIEAAWVDEHAVYLGASGFSHAGSPVAHPAYKRITRIAADGKTTVIQPERHTRRPVKIALSAWAAASTDDFVSGTSERFASIEAPATLERLGSPYGYGWVRLRFKHPQGARRAAFFDAADRLHLYLDSRFHALLGVGPGAAQPITTLPLKTAGHVLTALADNLGRRAEGNGMGEPKGLHGHAWHVAALRPGAPKIVIEKPFEPLAWRNPIFGLEDGDATSPRRITWKFEHRRKTPVMLTIPPLPDLAVLMVNGEPIQLIQNGRREHIALTPEQLSRGINKVQIAVLGDPDAALRALKDSAEFHDARECITDKAGWAFAKWEPPASARFKPIADPAAFNQFKGRPVWWRASFTLESIAEPCFFDAAGLSKGQLFINGHNAGRYFVATRTGKSVPPQSRYFLPEQWLRQGARNEILIFDEHGFPPRQARIVSEG